jgi:acetyl esterase/lipase
LESAGGQQGRLVTLSGHEVITPMPALLRCQPAFAVLLLAVLVPALNAAVSPLQLWPNGAPGWSGLAPKDTPTLTAYVPAQASGAAILLIPGGAYSIIYEGQAEPFAQWLNQQGITTFVLRYRLGSAGHRYPAQLQDAVQAMRLIRSNREKWKLDGNRIGVMGFSAGGHLVSTLLTHPEDGDVPGDAALNRVSARPDLAILCYPLISMINQPHDQTRRTLVGDSPPIELLRRLSGELQVSAGLPPCFIWHTNEDRMVPVEHSLRFAAALQAHGVPCELHLYQRGDHGTGLIGTTHPWFEDLLFWLKGQKFVR